MISGKSPRQKGDRLEREVVKVLTEAGIKAKRVPLSGSAKGYPGDIAVNLPGLDEVVLGVKAGRTALCMGGLRNATG